jgi:hypothetical protein
MLQEIVSLLNWVILYYRKMDIYWIEWDANKISNPKHGSTLYIFNKYKTFSVLIYSYINTSGNWENEKLCGNTRPEGRSIFTQFRVFPISTSVDITIYQYGKNVLYLFYNIAQRNIKKEIFRRFCVDIELYQHGFSVQNLQMLYYKYIYQKSFIFFDD